MFNTRIQMVAHSCHEPLDTIDWEDFFKTLVNFNHYSSEFIIINPQRMRDRVHTRINWQVFHVPWPDIWTFEHFDTRISIVLLVANVTKASGRLKKILQITLSSKIQNINYTIIRGNKENGTFWVQSVKKVILVLPHEVLEIHLPTGRIQVNSGRG